MALTVGSRLGHYDVTALIGEGGMGQVYQATDTKLNRQVALKILPEAFATDPDRLARFQREAQVLASLNHPNIAAIHGLEDSEGTKALVLELVEGPTLADRIAQGPIPVDEALPIAKQIAEALEAAHEAGVIHRDLKPANIKVRDDGTVKVLDFGLAKALDTTPQGDPSLSPTLTAAATQMGVIMGTAAYMSPEQARGKPIDRRADIWAFGVVLYEMLTGTRPFQGEDVSLTLASVMKSDVNVAVLPADLPETLRMVIRQCLQKDPKRRIRDIGDVQLAMEGAFEGVSAVSQGPNPVVQLHRWRLVVALALVGIVALATGLIVGCGMRDAEQNAGVLRAVVNPGRDTTLSSDPFQPGIAISPDGTVLVYRGRADDGSVGLYRRRLDTLDVERVRGADDAMAPFFSPDGNSVGFITSATRTRLDRLSLTGGAATSVATLPGIVIGASWGTDDQIVVGQDVGGLHRVAAAGGEPEALTALDETSGEVAHRWPFIIDERRVVLFAAFSGRFDSSGRLAALDLDTGVVTRLGLTGTTPRYLSTGHLIYVTDTGILRAVLFDVDQLAVLGEPVDVTEAVVMRTTGASDYTVSDTGRLAYVPGGSPEGIGTTLAWVSRDGSGITSATGVQEGLLGYPRLSPDQRRVALWRGEADVWILDLARQTEDRFTFDTASLYPLWSHDGAAIIFGSNRGDSYDIYSKPADSSGSESLILGDPSTVSPASVSSYGRYLLYHRQGSGGQRDLWVLPIGGTPVPFLETDFMETFPSLSPDGRWVAYLSDSSGDRRVYLQPFPAGGQVVPVSEGPGTEPVWSRDGRELFYRNGAQMMNVDVDVDANENITVGRAEVLFVGGYVPDSVGFGVANYDVSADGQRFLMVIEGGAMSGGQEQTITLVGNWFEELKRLVPVD